MDPVGDQGREKSASAKNDSGNRISYAQVGEMAGWEIYSGRDECRGSKKNPFVDKLVLSQAIGRCTEKAAPSPGSEATLIDPFSRSTRALVMASPSPAEGSPPVGCAERR